MNEDEADPASAARRLRRVVLIVGGMNFAYFFVEFSVALVVGSISLLADSVDFLEDTAICALILLALGWSLRNRAIAGKLMVLFMLVPSTFAGVEAIHRFSAVRPPDVLPLVLASLGAGVVNGVSALLLVRLRATGGSLSRAAFLSARNDTLINIAIILMGLVTAWTGSGWPDLLLGLFVIGIAYHAAWEIWEASEDERLTAKAHRGEIGD